MRGAPFVLALASACGSAPSPVEPKLADDVAFKDILPAVGTTSAAIPPARPPRSTLPWEPSLAVGRARARAEKRSIVVWVHAAWSVESSRLGRDILDDPAIQRQLAALVRVRVDVSQIAPDAEGRLAELDVGSVPALIVLDATGKERARLTSGADATRVSALLRVALDAH